MDTDEVKKFYYSTTKGWLSQTDPWAPKDESAPKTSLLLLPQCGEIYKTGRKWWQRKTWPAITWGSTAVRLDTSS